MVHIILHFVIPLLVALLFYKKNWKQAALLMIVTMLVDLDHLLADPIYDPERCSIGFHPLHTVPFILGYTAMFLVPIAVKLWGKNEKWQPYMRSVHLVGLGLLIHMALDGIDCLQ